MKNTYVSNSPTFSPFPTATCFLVFLLTFVNLSNAYSTGAIPFNNQFGVPVFSAASYSFSLADTAALGTVAGSVSASDPGGGAITYSITSGNTNGAFALDGATGVIKLAKQLNHHTQSVYTLTIRATNAEALFSEASVTINVKPGATVSTFKNISWSTAASQPFGTHEVHGVVVNGKLYSFSGYDIQKQPNWTPTKRAYVYDVAVNAWTQIADLPHTPNGTSFGGITHEGLTTDGTDIYFAGGYPSNGSGTGQVFSTRQVWKYSPATNTYSALPGLPEPLATGQLQYLSGKLHYFGGANAQRKDVTVHYVLDLDNLAAGWKAAATLLDGRNHGGSAVYEGKLYSIGGAHGQDNATITQKTVEVYDPTKDKWTKAADMPLGLDHISSSVFVLGERIFVLGGESKHNVKSSQVLAYTPATNTWAELTPLPTGKSAGIAVSINGVLYYSSGNFSKTTYKGLSVAETTLPVKEEGPRPVATKFSRLSVYPNPLREHFTIELPGAYKGEALLQLIDAAGRIYELGRIIVPTAGCRQDIDVSRLRLPSGAYFLKIRTDNGKSGLVTLLMQ